MSRYTVSPKAREDLKGIYRHVAQDSPSAAKRLRDALYESFRLLAKQPLLGQTCPNLRRGLRAFTVMSYVIFYVTTEQGIQIERVLHGARDIESLF
jgi:toxin ParE1/3/4